MQHDRELRFVPFEKEMLELSMHIKTTSLKEPIVDFLEI